jgi:hypothetical protein
MKKTATCFFAYTLLKLTPANSIVTRISARKRIIRKSSSLRQTPGIE